jgi:hypothetical protein
MNESTVQAKVRIRTSALGWRMWRNNVGVLLDATGRPVRYGLANDSTQVNASIKSGDLIGIRPVVITPEMVGQTIGQFVSIECKREGWKPSASDARYVAQRKWADLVNSLGGYAVITTGDL